MYDNKAVSAQRIVQGLIRFRLPRGADSPIVLRCVAGEDPTVASSFTIAPHACTLLVAAPHALHDLHLEPRLPAAEEEEGTTAFFKQQLVLRLDEEEDGPADSFAAQYVARVAELRTMLPSVPPIHVRIDPAHMGPPLVVGPTREYVLGGGYDPPTQEEEFVYLDEIYVRFGPRQFADQRVTIRFVQETGLAVEDLSLL